MGIAWKDMQVSNLHTGQPVMEVTGWAKERLDALTPAGQLRMVSAVSLDYVLLGLKSAGDQGPVKALPVSAEQDKWVHNFAVVPGSGDRLRLVTGVAGASWFGEVSLTFTQPSDQ